MTSKLHWEKSLASLFPDIAAEWHPTKNDSELTPNDVTRGNGSNVWWLCPNKHEYYSLINRRARNRTACPYCCSIVINEQTKEWT